MQIIVVVRGGVVTTVECDTPGTVTLIDYDAIEAGDPKPLLPEGARYGETDDADECDADLETDARWHRVL
jgi:hypothetical protein